MSLPHRVLQTSRDLYASASKRHPLLLCLSVAAALRLLSAWHGLGWFATDDLAQAIEQAHLWELQPESGMREAIRSPILSWIFWALVQGAHTLAIRDQAHVLHFCYSILGLWSLLGIVATYRLALSRFSEDVARKAAWLHALYAIMPYISTRALIEVLAIVPMMWGLVALDMAQKRQGRVALGFGFCAGLGLGLAALVRFQLGLLLPVAALLLLWPASPQDRGAKMAPRVFACTGLVLATLVVLALQTGIDMHLQRGFLGTLRAYLFYNVQYSGAAGVSPWYTYLLQFVVLSLPPVGLFLLRDTLGAVREHWTVGACWLAFVIVHSCIGHKEDRFMFSVLPLFFILLAQALTKAELRAVWGSKLVRAFWVLNALALGCATFSDGHRNITVPLLHIARQPTPQTAAVVGFIPSLIPSFYAGTQTHIVHVASVGELQRKLTEQPDFRPDYILLQKVPDAAQRRTLAQLPHLHCHAPVRCPGDWVDRVLVAVNRHNHRRAATALLQCIPYD